MRILFAFLLMFVCAPAISAQSCINFGDLPNVVDQYNTAHNAVDWSLVWPHITVRGIGVCAETAGEYGDMANDLTVDDSFYCHSYVLDTDLSSNTYCWCRIISPAVSSWFMVEDVADGECPFNCASYCADAIWLDAELRTKVFGTLTH